ncbi:MAG: asparagine synthase (glutamine-hydrolyzing) [Pseudomonadota bacterium]|nr:asparagine synthase (glutamine-hydrolyzing) [Pseudomonadota bacterium]
MCGICGQYNFRDQKPVSPAVIKAMTDTLVPRGPDDEGYHVSGALGLGFRRLSIIDLEGGHQPMSDTERSVWVVFNGEIFNFPELRKELETFGHRFRTRCDTEVILHGYKQWGSEVFHRLNGMFGVAIWDEAPKRLVLSRDAMGIKLVYYRVDDCSVLFGSEIRPILAALPDRPDVDPTALNIFLRYRYTPSPLTLYRDIRKLAPGTMAVFENGEWSVQRWYRFKPQHFSPPKSDVEARDELLEIYQRALKRHLISDVPVGLLLSGGMDSGLLLGLMSLYGESWPTYTVGYGRTAYNDDELVDAAETARIFSARNASVELSRDTFEQALPKIVTVLEEPIAASSIVPMYFVCERARRDVKVALVGQGPDELFGGYTRHLGVHYGRYWRSLPRLLRSPIEVGIQRLPRSEALKRGAYSLGIENRLERYQHVFSIMPGSTIDALFQDGLLPPGAGDSVRELWEDLADEMEGTDELGGFQVLEIRSSLPDELLMYADKLSMAHGLEVRVPFLDREIVEYVERLPASFKVRRGQRKWLHRRVCEKFLPPPILNRKKRGFAVNVVDDWFQGSLSSSMDGYLMSDESLIFEHLKPEGVRRLLQEHRMGRCDNHKILFSLVVFEEWLRASQQVARRANTWS